MTRRRFACIIPRFAAEKGCPTERQNVMDPVNLSTQFNFALESLRQTLTQERATAQALTTGTREQGLDANPAPAPSSSGNGSRGSIVDILA